MVGAALVGRDDVVYLCGDGPACAAPAPIAGEYAGA